MLDRMKQMYLCDICPNIKALTPVTNYFVCISVWMKVKGNSVQCHHNPIQYCVTGPGCESWIKIQVKVLNLEFVNRFLSQVKVKARSSWSDSILCHMAGFWMRIEMKSLLCYSERRGHMVQCHNSISSVRERFIEKRRRKN